MYCKNSFSTKILKSMGAATLINHQIRCPKKKRNIFSRSKKIRGKDISRDTLRIIKSNSVQSIIFKIYFFTVATLTEGMAFGELALLSHKPRMATVTCLDNCHFMILTKDAYEYVIGKMERRMLADKVDFLATLPAFSLMTKSTLSKVTVSMTKQQITKGNLLYREGDPADHIYIVVNGELEVTKNIPDIRPGLRLIDEIYRDPLRTKKLQNSKNVQMARKDTKKLNLFILGKGQMLGDEDIGLQLPTYETTAKCITSKVEFYEMKRDDFLRLQQVGKATWKKITELVLMKKMRIDKLVYNANHQIERFEEQIFQEIFFDEYKQVKEEYENKLQRPVQLSISAVKFLNDVVRTSAIQQPAPSSPMFSNDAQIYGQKNESIDSIKDRNSINSSIRKSSRDSSLKIHRKQSQDELVESDDDNLSQYMKPPQDSKLKTSVIQTTKFPEFRPPRPPTQQSTFVKRTMPVIHHKKLFTYSKLLYLINYIFVQFSNQNNKHGNFNGCRQFLCKFERKVQIFIKDFLLNQTINIESMRNFLPNSHKSSTPVAKKTIPQAALFSNKKSQIYLDLRSPQHQKQYQQRNMSKTSFFFNQKSIELVQTQPSRNLNANFSESVVGGFFSKRFESPNPGIRNVFQSGACLASFGVTESRTQL